jgi:transposase-like protein
LTTEFIELKNEIVICYDIVFYTLMGLHKRQGRVFLNVVKNCSKAELMPILQGRIVEGSDVYPDGWKAYDGLVTNGYQHHRVHHHENEFARGKIMLTA